jgi:hypothetical protein
MDDIVTHRLPLKDFLEGFALVTSASSSIKACRPHDNLKVLQQPEQVSASGWRHCVRHHASDATMAMASGT